MPSVLTNRVSEFLNQVAADDAARAELEAVETDDDFKLTALKLGGERGFSFTSSEIDEFFTSQFEGPAIFSYLAEDLDRVAGSVVASRCVGPVTTICIISRDCWGSLC